MGLLMKKWSQVIKNWLGKEGLQLIKTFRNEEKENAKWQKKTFSVLSDKFTHASIE